MRPLTQTRSWGRLLAHATLRQAQLTKDAKYLQFHRDQGHLFAPLAGTTTGMLNPDAVVLCWAFAQAAAVKRRPRARRGSEVWQPRRLWYALPMPASAYGICYLMAYGI